MILAGVALVLVVIIALVARACSGGSQWHLSGELKGLQNGNLRLVWTQENGATAEQWVQAQGDRFDARGTAADGPVLLAVYHGQTRLFTVIVIENGDHVELDGNMMAPFSVRAHGNDACHEWAEWRAAHTTLYQQEDRKALNTEIEKFVHDHPKELLSTLLVLVDYRGDSQQASMRLLNTIDKAVRPASLTASFTSLEKLLPVDTSLSLGNIKLWNRDGDMENVTADGRPVVVLLWDVKWLSSADRKTLVADINRRREEQNAKVYAIFMEPDTQPWRPTARMAEMESWHHLWAPAGATTACLKPLAATMLPIVITADSTGHILSQGATLK